MATDSNRNSIPSGCLRIAAFCLTLLGVSAVAHATQVMAVALPQMSREADLIVHARVGSQRVQWNKDHSRPLTLTEIEVLTPIKGGRAGEVLTIYQVGGELDGRTYQVVGALPFVAGEEMVFFAYRYDDANLGPMIVSYGMGLGKYEVRRVGGTAVVSPTFGDVAFVERGKDGALRSVGPPPTHATPLETFVRQVRDALREQGGAR